LTDRDETATVGQPAVPISLAEADDRNRVNPIACGQDT
jgi:hypothetical protein